MRHDIPPTAGNERLGWGGNGDGISDTEVINLVGIERIYSGPPEVRAVGPVTLAIGLGAYIAVQGPSGSGKSTLLNILGLLDRPTGGSYFLQGRDVSRLSEADRSATRCLEIGIVFQAFHLLPHRTAVENVELAQLYRGVPRRARRERAVEALRSVGLAHRLDSLPTVLSGGERQRVAVARALANDPPVLLCDEPTGNLDSTSAGRLLDLIDDLRAARGLTVIMITHASEVAERADCVITIRDGRIA